MSQAGSDGDLEPRTFRPGEENLRHAKVEEVLGLFAKELDPPPACYERRSGRRSARAVSDERLLAEIRTTLAKNYEACGYRRTWKALLRAGHHGLAGCTLQRLMKANGIRGAGVSFLAFVADVFSRKVVGWQLTSWRGRSCEATARRLPEGRRPRRGPQCRVSRSARSSA